MARHGLVATVEATSDQLGVATRLTRELPELKVVVDHFGWPIDLSDAGRRVHLDRLAELAGRPNVAIRLDAIGTSFGPWTVERVRPWLLASPVRPRPVHARFRSTDRAAAVRLRALVPRL
jgi:predicted TIM-barrel fold metal-dependent hydrolase